MIKTTNPAGYIFEWPDGSDFIEIYHPKDSFPDVPIAAVRVGFRHDLTTLNKYANETSEWGSYA